MALEGETSLDCDLQRSTSTQVRQESPRLRSWPASGYSHAREAGESLPRTVQCYPSLDNIGNDIWFLLAVSRAMCLACIVATPRLLESRARTIEQMRLINALCRFAEMAG